jgi:uncharacterized protein YijF (DUF1287 family)
MFVCCECCVLSGRGLCDELITRPEEYYRLWCVVVCDLETSRMRKSWPALGRSKKEKKAAELLLYVNELRRHNLRKYFRCKLKKKNLERDFERYRQSAKLQWRPKHSYHSTTIFSTLN